MTMVIQAVLLQTPQPDDEMSTTVQWNDNDVHTFEIQIDNDDNDVHMFVI